LAENPSPEGSSLEGSSRFQYSFQYNGIIKDVMIR